MKISNPTSNQKYEYVNQHADALEDNLNDFFVMKVNRAKALNYSIVDADNH